MQFEFSCTTYAIAAFQFLCVIDLIILSSSLGCISIFSDPLTPGMHL